MVNDNFDKLIDRALGENAAPREDFAVRLELGIDRLVSAHRLRRRKAEWTLGGIAASILVVGIVMTNTHRSDKLYARDTFDDPVEAAQFMSSVLGGISRELNNGLEKSFDQLINGISIIHESANNQKSDDDEC